MHAHLAAQVRQRSPLRLGADSVTTNDVVEQRPVVCLDLLELRSVHLDHAPHALATRERFRRRNGGLRLPQYPDQAAPLVGGGPPPQPPDPSRLHPPPPSTSHFP